MLFGGAWRVARTAAGLLFAEAPAPGLTPAGFLWLARLGLVLFVFLFCLEVFLKEQDCKLPAT
jgi:hypothetical protein